MAPSNSIDSAPDEFISVFTKFRQGIGARASSLGCTLVVTFLYMAIGCLVFMTTEPRECDAGSCHWTFTDSVYFCTVTMSTVGYGDLSPTMPGTKVFTFVWIILGIVIVFSAVASSIGSLIRPLTQRGRVVLGRQFPQETVDLNGDGTVDYMKPRAAPIFYLKNLLPLFVLVLIVQLSCAGIFLAFEDWKYGDAMWHCLVTATTVGYGDVSGHAPVWHDAPTADRVLPRALTDEHRDRRR